MGEEVIDEWRMELGQLLKISKTFHEGFELVKVEESLIRSSSHLSNHLLPLLLVFPLFRLQHFSELVHRYCPVFVFVQDGKTLVDFLVAQSQSFVDGRGHELCVVQRVVVVLVEGVEEFIYFVVVHQNLVLPQSLLQLLFAQHSVVVFVQDFERLREVVFFLLRKGLVDQEEVNRLLHSVVHCEVP